MKYNKYINLRKAIMLTVLFNICVSCDDRLNVLPEDNPVSEIVFSNGALALGVVEGMYSSAQQDDVLNGTLTLSGEWQSDNVDFKGTFPTFNEIRLYSTLSTNNSINSFWDDNYETIGSANAIIDNIPLVQDDSFTQAERNQAIAEAKFMRALIYLNISSFYGHPVNILDGVNNLSVPLVTSSELGLEVPRATIGEVHDFIEAELLEIIPVIASGTRIKASSGAAKALLARLYLYQDRFEEAADIANEVINDGFYGLATDYTFYNNRDSSEHIFTLANNADDGQDSNEGFSGLSNPNNLGGRGDTPFSEDLLAAHAEEPGDLRFTTLSQIGNDANGDIRTFPSKFPDFTTDADDAPVIRITEMYLTRAEGNFRAGTSMGDSPLNDINTLRSRAGLSDLTSVDLSVILNERRKELAFEGQRRMDLLRNNMNLRRPGQDMEAASAPGMDRTIYPIPQVVRDLSPFLEQNSGY